MCVENRNCTLFFLTIFFLKDIFYRQAGLLRDRERERERERENKGSFICSFHVHNDRINKIYNIIEIEIILTTVKVSPKINDAFFVVVVVVVVRHTFFFSPSF